MSLTGPVAKAMNHHVEHRASRLHRCLGAFELCLLFLEGAPIGESITGEYQQHNEDSGGRSRKYL